MQRERFLIYPWNISTTDSWSTEGLNALRDESAQEVALVIATDREVDEAYITAMAEYLSHGHQRKAAEVTRVLIDVQPSIVSVIKSKFPSRLANDLLFVKLEDLPSKPSEFPLGTIEYVQ